ncbi:hypothetical protein RUM43_014769 [Polyplax serrata]|uniref:Uncharacterized protein n=1 Tax=Polyplax serrata TaxID=468196 RepID=A0AAN8NWC0_POLSC
MENPYRVGFALLCSSAIAFSAQQNLRTTPVPILKQINRHNDDGSYSYGFESADGTFKIETKRSSGEVFGKYGYIGDDGQVRIVEYGASKRGFEPKGKHINVAPPTISNIVEDSGEYKEVPLKTFSQRKVFKIPQRIPQTHKYQVERVQSFGQTPLNERISALPQFPLFKPQFQRVPVLFDPAIFNGHPATNIDINTGSYTVTYTS